MAEAKNTRPKMSSEKTVRERERERERDCLYLTKKEITIKY